MPSLSLLTITLDLSWFLRRLSFMELLPKSADSSFVESGYSMVPPRFCMGCVLFLTSCLIRPWAAVAPPER